ncbi:uncharacterized protein CDAR_246121 [Caerostris darwini]|uniref:Uncharacterized protein n=1 Tax=Caerostris darwini TaxID=1538125 RepID=A0AAV4QT54_9ARAC|nr:uncharacterized protein CDAR_246121 [Caerostris darwini]
MVMEAATLSGPHRKCTVVPVQKSLSLPSYARASGEGIDHRLIFAALEQKEKVRRKSRIFAARKEKCERQSHLFCLPIPSSGARCRETSLSSDTSCSSLEYQKSSPVPPKNEITAKSKEEDIAGAKKEDTTVKPKKENVSKQQLPVYEAAATIQPESKSNLNPSRMHQNAVGWDTNRSQTNLDVNVSQKTVDSSRKGQRSPMDTLKLNVGSSDSMDRSSRSSSDSLSRKERMIALKARVEAAREKYGNTSSEEEEAESRSAITRYNSDGVIHRSVRDVKSRSYLREKRLRRRSQDEFSIKKTHRKQNLTLSLHPERDEIRLDLEKACNIQNSASHLDIKTDFCPSPNFPDMLKKNYFSDFPNKENAARFVQARIRHIEDEERKRRSGSDFREKFGLQSPHNLENSSPMSTELRHPSEKLNGPSSILSEKKSSNLDLSMRSSPIPRSSQAPTPPPRSPKSMTFINKALIQHQNSYLHQENSWERKRVFMSNVPAVSYSQIFDKYDSKAELASQSPNSTFERQKMRELISTRRKTCGNFDFIENSILDDLCSLGNSVDSNTSNLLANKKFSSVMPFKKTETKGYFSSTETQCVPSEDDTRSKLWKSKWQENEQRKEYMFNSLESKKKSNPPTWQKWKTPPLKTETCLCHLFPESKLSCSCKNKLAENKQIFTNKNENSSTLEKFSLMNTKDVSSLPVHYSLKNNKSDMNRNPTQEMNRNEPFKSHQARNGISHEEDNFNNENSDKLSAAANLDSAMEELENVYRSLKMSSDNLSDRNSISNVSMSDDDAKFPKPKNKDIIGHNDSHFQRRSSVCETGLNSNKNTHLSNRQAANFSPLNSSFPLSRKTDISQVAIDELFNDLTQQLDLEQKLLKEPRDNRPQQPKLSIQTNPIEPPKRSNNMSPQVSIHKEFYENLCRNNRDQNKNLSPLVCENGTFSQNESLDKKRFKAVRSLSENISYLMSATNSDKPASKKATNNVNAKISASDPSSPKYYERVTTQDSHAPDSKREANLKLSNLSLKSEEAAQNSKRDEIRHIRVSMDTNAVPSKSVTTFSDTKQYPSLSSAVSATQPTNKSEVPKPCLPEQKLEPKESLDVLDETGLEKLLNSLLGEVPERQSSLPQSKDLAPATPPPVVPGEMRVLQHLDVIRLKPVPS